MMVSMVIKWGFLDGGGRCERAWDGISGAELNWDASTEYYLYVVSAPQFCCSDVLYGWSTKGIKNMFPACSAQSE